MAIKNTINIIELYIFFLWLKLIVINRFIHISTTMVEIKRNNIFQWQ